MGKAFALDWGAVLLSAQFLDLDRDLVADLLPSIEAVILGGMNGDTETDSDEWDLE